VTGVQTCALPISFSERFQFTLRVGLRYAWQMLYYTPVALFYGLRHPSPRIVSDHEFEERFDNTVFNKMIVPFRNTGSRSAEPTYQNPIEQGPVEETQLLMLDRQEQLAQQLAWERFPEQMERLDTDPEVR